jgi:hypothetical protein
LEHHLVQRKAIYWEELKALQTDSGWDLLLDVLWVSDWAILLGFAWEHWKEQPLVDCWVQWWDERKAVRWEPSKALQME